MHDEHRILTQCPHCSLRYSASDIRVVSGVLERTILHVTCSGCMYKMLISIMKRREGIACFGISTDCSYSEALRLLEGGVITVDDVINVHEALQLDKFTQMG